MTQELEPQKRPLTEEEKKARDAKIAAAKDSKKDEDGKHVWEKDQAE